MASKFAHQHYKAIAETLMANAPLCTDGDSFKQWEILCLALGNMFQRDNPAFNRDRFIAACNGDYQNGRDRPR